MQQGQNGKANGARAYGPLVVTKGTAVSVGVLLIVLAATIGGLTFLVADRISVAVDVTAVKAQAAAAHEIAQQNRQDVRLLRDDLSSLLAGMGELRQAVGRIEGAVVERRDK